MSSDKGTRFHRLKYLMNQRIYDKKLKQKATIEGL